MKKTIYYSILIILVSLLTGCSGSGGSSTGELAVASGEEIAAVETSLLLDRTLAAESITSTTPNLLASTATLAASQRYRNRTYQTENSNGVFGLKRGSGSCIAMLSSGTIVIGSETAKVEKLDTGAFVITRGNGTVIETPAPTADGEITGFEINGVEWEINFSTASPEILAVITNLRSGMILSITELDDGSLTIVRDSSQVFSGRWAEDGNLELSDNQGKRYRYRYGKSL